MKEHELKIGIVLIGPNKRKLLAARKKLWNFVNKELDCSVTRTR